MSEYKDLKNNTYSVTQRVLSGEERKIYTEEEIIQALENNGFVLLKVEGHLGEDKTQSDRISFFAQYKGGKR